MNDLHVPMVQKRYETNLICPRLKATVSNMIQIYQTISNVPHVDRLVSVSLSTDSLHKTEATICTFEPVGRAYLPINWTELLDALVCIAEALVGLHALHIMHRDIRWANVLHVVQDGQFTREWALFDFEFACVAPQPALEIGTLTPANHAPEMVNTVQVSHTEMHDTAVDIWGLGYLMEHAFVDCPREHKTAFAQLQKQCLQVNPRQRPQAYECLEQLRALQSCGGSGDGSSSCTKKRRPNSDETF
jgi:serine/threonine protein kinase